MTSYPSSDATRVRSLANMPWLPVMSNFLFVDDKIDLSLD